MITIRLMGGLGNQLFQLTAMTYLRTAFGRSVRCDTSWFETDGLAGDTPRALEIDGLLEPSERTGLPLGLARAAYSVKNPRAFREQGNGDDLLRRLPAHWAWAAGYFQRAEYPTLMRRELSRRLLPVFDGMPSGSKRPKAIAVHIRLGDYLTSRTTQAHHGVTGAQYFAEAVERIRQDVGDLPIRVFTDSPDLLGSSYLADMAGDIEISASTGSWETLGEMSSCAGIVMSNSSFSWWAAFAATVLRSRSIPIVMPTPWFAAESEADTLMRVDGWRQMQRLVSTP